MTNRPNTPASVPAMPVPPPPANTAPPLPVVRAIHTHAVGATGIGVAVLAVLYGLAQPGVLDGLHDPGKRIPVGLGLIAAALAAYLGKGALAAHAPDDTIPGPAPKIDAGP